mmetsp:Transcript_92865/g.258642  ORF Transcript_92865/g.258642 Transcript_92865/m.258642 type:complete len:272 (-) Transcript_92865:176-991(-)
MREHHSQRRDAVSLGSADGVRRYDCQPTRQGRTRKPQAVAALPGPQPPEPGPGLRLLTHQQDLPGLHGERHRGHPGVYPGRPAALPRRREQERRLSAVPGGHTAVVPDDPEGAAEPRALRPGRPPPARPRDADGPPGRPGPGPPVRQQRPGLPGPRAHLPAAGRRRSLRGLRRHHVPCVHHGNERPHPERYRPGLHPRDSRNVRRSAPSAPRKDHHRWPQAASGQLPRKAGGRLPLLQPGAAGQSGTARRRGGCHRLLRCHSLLRANGRGC